MLGQGAVKRLRKSRRGHDVVLMDIQMPVLSGIEATREIRRIEAEKQRKPGTVILGMTGGWVPALAEECEAAGMNGFLPKPFKPSELSDIITDFYLKYTH